MGIVGNIKDGWRNHQDGLTLAEKQIAIILEHKELK